MFGEHMMNWWGIPFMGYYMLAIWAVFIVIAFLVYRDAEERGMDGLLWFILVILPWIGIVSLLIYLIMREERPKKIPSEAQPTSKEPNCFCGARVKETKVQQKQEAKLICPYCRAENPPNAKFCNTCGSSLEP